MARSMSHKTQFHMSSTQFFLVSNLSALSTLILHIILPQARAAASPCRNIVRIRKSALTGVAQLVGRHPAKRKVTGLIPCQGTWVGCGFGAQEATDQCFSHIERHNVSLSFPFPSPLSK